MGKMVLDESVFNASFGKAGILYHISRSSNRSNHFLQLMEMPCWLDRSNLVSKSGKLCT